MIWGLRWGLPQVEFLTLQTLCSRRVCCWIGLGPLQSGVHHPFLSVLPLMLFAASEGSLSFRGWRLSCVAPFGCGSIVQARPRDDGYAFPGHQKYRVHVESSTVSRSFEVGRVVSRWGSRSQRPPPVPFFSEVHKELTRSWKAPFTARNKSCGSSPLTTLDGGAALGYTGIPSVERSVAMQLCPSVKSSQSLLKKYFLKTTSVYLSAVHA